MDYRQVVKDLSEGRKFREEGQALSAEDRSGLIDQIAVDLDRTGVFPAQAGPGHMGGVSGRVINKKSEGSYEGWHQTSGIAGRPGEITDNHEFDTAPKAASWYMEWLWPA